MPFPDVLPPEIWHHTVAISSIDRAYLIPWLSVAPYTCAKGMHNAAFARIFRNLHIGAQREDDWLEMALILSRYAREAQLRSAVRSVSAWWNAAMVWEKNQTEDADYKVAKHHRLMKMLEDLICDVLSKLEGVRHLSWSNCFRTFPIKEKIFCRLEQHFPSLTSLSLSGAAFDEPLDLRSATSLSSLSLSHVRLSAPPFSPPLLLRASLKNLLFIDVFSRIDGETSGLWETEGLGGLPMVQSLPPSHILASLDLSHIQSLGFGEIVGFSQLDFSHVFPPTFGRISTGNQLGSFCLFDVGLPVLTALSTCCAFPQLHTFRMKMRPRDVLNVVHAERAIHNLSSFIGRQNALENVSVGIADMYTLDPNDYQEDDVHAFELALAKPHFRDAFARLKVLRRLSLGTYTFGSQYPAFHEEFARSLSALQTFIIRCVKATNSAGALLDDVARAFNRFSSLHSVGFTARFPQEDTPAAKKLVKLLPKVLKCHTPRVQYCSAGGKLWRLGGQAGIEELCLIDPENRKVFRDLDLFI